MKSMWKWARKALLVLITAAPALAQETITVLTYNINYGLDPKGYSNLLRVAQLIRQYKPDLVAIQETDSATLRSYRRNQIRQLAGLTGMQYAFAGADSYEGGRIGLGVLSRYPIIAHNRVLLPNPDSLAPRILQDAYVELPDGRSIRFTNTQLEPKSFVNRGVQLATLRQVLGNSIQPIIWAGDLSTDPEDPIVVKLRENWDDAGADARQPTIHNSGARTDYILTLRGAEFELVRYRVLNEPTIAPHLPVLVKYRLKNSASPPSKQQRQ
ncbi:endonuclease/exonuclease/phosphatase family protein [Tellurirhabdus rosea]|uniref:endonuclease/exonuclease/phosphatase family protein n=1 Tax=Tellurirhabdus rosea TaxID=2674997 RepID=UPI002255B4BF|nr:endonuclease/exonuclease/phosphatase family protein [Tellurirhabdus rosea]